MSLQQTLYNRQRQTAKLAKHELHTRVELQGDKCLVPVLGWQREPVEEDFGHSHGVLVCCCELIVFSRCPRRCARATCVVGSVRLRLLRLHKSHHFTRRLAQPWPDHVPGLADVTSGQSNYKKTARVAVQFALLMASMESRMIQNSSSYITINITFSCPVG